MRNSERGGRLAGMEGEGKIMEAGEIGRCVREEEEGEGKIMEAGEIGRCVREEEEGEIRVWG